MSVDTIFDNYLKTIRNNYKLGIFSVEKGFNPKTVLENACSSFNDARKAINNGFLYLFNDLEQPNGDQQNFLIINSIAEIFRSIPMYSYDTKEFADSLDYAYTRGQIYTSYSKGSDGKFIQKLYDQVPKNITNICNEYQKKFDNYVPPVKSASEPEEPEKTPLESFWDKYSAEFTTKINTQSAQMETLANKFKWFYNKITEFKNLGVNASKLQASAHNFLNAKEYTQIVAPTMEDVFSVCRTKFKNYDPVIDNIYEIWLTAKEHVKIEYSELNTNDANTILSKIYSSKVLEYINFYNNSKKLYDELLTFFTQYGIN